MGVVGSLAGWVKVDLDGRVPDAESITEHLVRTTQEAFVSLNSWTDHVRRQCHKAARDCPDVKVVDSHDMWKFQQRRAHLIDIDVTRRILHQHCDRLPNERP
jgi:hypothetical protein